jgi:TonB-linked SusC/RagA family outer membrane protein
MTVCRGANVFWSRVAARTAVGLTMAVGQLTAQTSSQTPLQFADRGPGFYRSSDAGPVPVDVRGVALLQRLIAVDLDDVPVPDAIAAIARVAHVSIAYSDLDIEGSHRVTLQAGKITLAAALTAVLVDESLDVNLHADGGLSLARRIKDGPSSRRQDPDSVLITGIVTDAQTHAPLVGVVVRVLGVNRTTTTAANGTYSVLTLLRGPIRIVARRLGYLPKWQSVPEGARWPDTVNFQLLATPQELDQVVTTISGNQRLIELGNAIGTIQAADVVPTSPITGLGDLLTARVPGVQVFEDGGLTGEAPTVSIRGLNSFTVSNQPLLYIDGVRVDNTTAQGGGTSGRFNDIDPETIESIDVIKGPSAAVPYGTDAANGVILIKTKQGVIGRPRWTVYTQQGTVTPASKNRITSNYYGWGHTTDGSNTPVDCTLGLSATSGCTLDSLTHFTPLLNPATTPFGTGSRQEYGAQVLGGTPGWRYFFGGAYNSELGYLKMPDADVTILRAERGGLGVSSDEIRPNGLRDYSVHENISADLNPATTVSVTGFYDSRDARIPSSSSLVFAALGPGYRDNNDGWFLGARPLYQFAGIHDENTAHFSGAVNLDWRPASWFSAHATAGLDQSNVYLNELTRLGEQGPLGQPGGSRTNAKDNTTLYTYSAYGVAAVPLPLRLTSTSTIGANYNRTLDGSSLAAGTNLAPGCTSLTCAGTTTASETNTDTKVAGLFAEQKLSYADRLFLAGGVRVDGGSTFGNSISTVVYPKASVSWVVSREPFFPASAAVQSFRLRGAYGESGTQPPPTRKLDIETAQPAVVHDTVQTGTGLPVFGNPNLKPERQREFEGGADADLFGNRVHIEGTVYVRRTHDAIIPVAAPASLGSYVSFVNAGAVSNRGYEGLVSVRPVDTRYVAWDLTFNGSVNHNKLLSLGSGISPATNVFAPQLRVGYPLYSWFGYPVLGYSVSSNGAVLPSNVQVGTNQAFIGPSYPSDQLTFSSTISLLHSLLQIRAQVDRRSGFNLIDIRYLSCSVNACQEAFDPHTPLSERVAYAALTAGAGGTQAPYVENGSFTRLREVSVTLNVPSSMTRWVAHDVAVTVSGRNLALWTQFRGADPETAGAAGGGTGAGAYSDNGYIVPGRYFLVRVSAGF